jgi:hypothetical protein
MELGFGLDEVDWAERDFGAGFSGHEGEWSSVEDSLHFSRQGPSLLMGH